MRLAPNPVVLSVAKDLASAPKNASGSRPRSFAALRTTRRAVLAAPALPLVARAARAADLDVAIIGAGAAGFAAAHALMGARKTVLVLEARDRTGGRVLTDTSLGIPFDHGAPTRPEPTGASLVIGTREISPEEYARFAKVAAEIARTLEALRTQAPGLDPRAVMRPTDALEKLALAEALRRSPFAPLGRLPVAEGKVPVR